MDLSPVDLCAKAIIDLLGSNDSQTVFHIYNNNTIKLQNLLKLSNFNYKIVSDEKMIDTVKNSSNPRSLHILDDLRNKKVTLTSTVNEKTISLLNSHNFYWNLTDEKYINNFFKIFN